MTPSTVSLTLTPYEASVIYDNLIERLREEDDNAAPHNEVGRALLSVCRKLEEQGVSR